MYILSLKDKTNDDFWLKNINMFKTIFLNI